MQEILVSGGNSGIGLEATRRLLSLGHRVVMLGRDPRKGDAALGSFGEAAERASFIAVDLSTRDGVEKAASSVLARCDSLDAILHSTGVLITKDRRTADGLNLFFAVNYLSRYHLTQLLLPALRKTTRARVVMLTARIDPSARIDLRLFPRFESFSFRRMSEQVQLGNVYYAAHLARAEPGLLAGVVNAGAAKTDILRATPWYMRVIAMVAGRFFFDSLEQSAHNAVEASRRDDGRSGTYWDEPGAFDRRTPIESDEATLNRVIETSRELTEA